MAHRPAAVAALLCMLALVLSACGGNGEGTPIMQGDTSADTSSTVDTAAAGSEEETAPKAGGQASGTTESDPVAQLSPEQQVDYAIKGVLASGVPGLACGRFASENYVKTTFGGRAGCRKSTVPASAATYVEVTKIEIDGSKASAEAKPTGGPSDGEEITVTLVRQDGTWMVDSLKSNAPVGP